MEDKKKNRKVSDKKMKKPVAVVDCAVDMALLEDPKKLRTLDDWAAAADAHGMSYGKFVLAMREGKV